MPCYRGLLASTRVHKRQVIDRFERADPLLTDGESAMIGAITEEPAGLNLQV